MKNLLFHWKAVKTGTHKAEVGARAETFWKSELEPEPKQIGWAPQHWLKLYTIMTGTDIRFIEKKKSINQYGTGPNKPYNSNQS